MSKVKVFTNDNEECYEGDVEASLSPGNALIILEDIPDVTAKSQSGTVRRIKAMYNPSIWTVVELE